MKSAALLTSNAIIFIALGIAFTIYAPLMIDLLGILNTDSSSVSYWYITSFARMFGVALFGYGFLLWSTKRILDQTPILPKTQQGLVFALFLSNLIGLIVAITQQVSIWGSVSGWFLVGVFIFLTSGYGYLLINKSSQYER